MKLSHRRSFFYLSAIVFIILGVYLTLLAQGLVFNFKTFSIIKTGGIFLDFKPTNGASLFVNGNKKEIQTSFINEGTLVKNLKPGIYHISISKNGYYGWQKILEVKSGQVAPRTSIRLFPKNARFITISTSTTGFWQTEDGLIIKNTSSTILYKKNKYKDINIISVNGKNILSTKKIKNEENYILTSLENTPLSINISDLFSSLLKNKLSKNKTQISDIKFHPFNSNKLIINSSSSIFILDTKNKTLKQISFSSSTPIINFETNNSDIVVNLKNKLGFINLISLTKKIYKIPSEYVEKIKSNSDGNYILFTNKDSFLFLYNKETKLLRAFGTKPINFFFSPEEKRIVEVFKDKVELIYLKTWNKDLRKNAFEKTYIKFQEDIDPNSLRFLDENHLAFLSENKLIISEIDEIQPINSAVIAHNIKSFKVINNKIIYALTAKNELREINL